MDLMYVIGQPGVGKSTLVDHLTAGLGYEETDSPLPFRRYDCGVLELGKRRADFPGTDAYPMNVQPSVITFLGGLRPKLVLAEGDRLANDKFFGWMRDVLGYTLHIYVLWGNDIAGSRRTARGHSFDAQWLKGRLTKVEKLAYSWNATPLDAELELDKLADLINNPVMAALRAGKGVAVG